MTAVQGTILHDTRNARYRSESFRGPIHDGTIEEGDSQFPVCDMSRETLSPTLIDMADNRQQTAKESKGFRNRLKKAFGFGSQSTHQSRSNSPSDVPVIGADPPVPSPVVGAHPPVPSSPPVAEPPTLLMPLASPYPL